jgi:hypothetical protein
VVDNQLVMMFLTSVSAISALENLVLISKVPPQYFGHFSSKIAINRRSTFQKFATFGKFYAKAEIAASVYYYSIT